MNYLASPPLVVRTAMASGQRFYEVSSTSSDQENSLEDTVKDNEKIINALDLSQDPRVIEMLEDLRANMQNFTKVDRDEITYTLREGEGFVNLFRHENGLEIIQRNNYSAKAKKFFALKRPWFCPIFTPAAGFDRNTLFELNLETFGYQTLSKIWDGKYEKEGRRLSFTEGQRKHITDTVRYNKTGIGFDNTPPYGTIVSDLGLYQNNNTAISITISNTTDPETAAFYRLISYYYKMYPMYNTFHPQWLLMFHPLAY